MPTENIQIKMCGIFGLFGDWEDEKMDDALSTIKYRGPDNTKKVTMDDVYVGFHRLAINGLDKISDQPFDIKDVMLCCNGEIYNYKQLAEDNDFTLKTHSDCEIIIHMYLKYGIEKTCQEIEGEFSFILYDKKSKILYSGRDILGLRGLFIGTNKDGSVAFASEAKALNFCDEVTPFPPRCWWSSLDYQFKKYYEFEIKVVERCENVICQEIASTFEEGVKSRVLMSDQKVGFLLSGGLDSSLCVALGAKYLRNQDDIPTFSIGLKGSQDLKYAQIVADYLGTKHTTIELTEEEFLREIPETIRIIESYDVTTVRASNGHRLVARYISQNTDIKVLISGEVSDELTCGYMVFGGIENNDDLNEESIRMLNEIHLYDTLRSDRSIACNGLEGRYPFAYKKFVELYLSIPPNLKSFYDKSRMEKYLLRKSFANAKVLPENILFRKKDGFSDGVSSTTRPTKQVIQEYIDTLITDDYFNKMAQNYTYLTPETKEELYYRDLFHQYYPTRETLIPKHWRPNPKFYGKIIEPSGRILNSYSS